MRKHHIEIRIYILGHTHITSCALKEASAERCELNTCARTISPLLREPLFFLFFACVYTRLRISGNFAFLQGAHTHGHTRKSEHQTRVSAPTRLARAKDYFVKELRVALFLFCNRKIILFFLSSRQFARFFALCNI